MTTALKYGLFCAVIVFQLSCKNHYSLLPPNNEETFSNYWNSGYAEISTYELQQSRYGDNHDGHAILIYVTEDFSRKKLVKLDEPQKHPKDAVKVLKLNFNKAFTTGMSDYRMMSSVYTPIEYSKYPHSLKSTSSVQDWSGQTFMQTNWKGNRYEVEQMSYVESEGDSKYSLVNTWLEDEIWNKIRIAPNTLPIGKVKMIASAFYIRFSHQENKVYEAEASLITHPEHYTYIIYYPETGRRLEIDFENTFPNRIRGWKETSGGNEITTGRLLKTVLSDYWNYNHPKDEVLRDSLLLH